MQNGLFRKGVVLWIMLLFFGTSIIPSISGYYIEFDQKHSIESLENVDVQAGSSVTLYTFGKSGTKKHDATLSSDDADKVYAMFEELKYDMTYLPLSDQTQKLKTIFIDLLDENNLMPEGVSKDDFISLLNPPWVKLLQNEGDVFNFAGFSPLLASRATGFFCSVTSGGAGIILPFALLPRPRMIVAWQSNALYDVAVTAVGGLLTNKGFFATGKQNGVALGFVGIGMTYGTPVGTVYALTGYALMTMVTADHIESYPPNNLPIISDETPTSGSHDIPVSLSELSFRIEDPDGDRMDYIVITEPDIGSGNGYNKQDGFFNVPVSGLEYDKIYRWTVQVNDGKDWAEKQYSFITEERPPFDPFEEGWLYRKKITVDHNLVTDDLSNFPVLISSVDSDIRDRAQDDGDDILFMDGDGVANKLYYEIEKFEGSTGELAAWVKIPSLSGSQDISFYMYYGNPGSNSQQFPEKVWDSDYVMVYHMNGVDWSSIDDSTSYGNDVIGTYQIDDPEYNAIGKIGKCVDFNANCMLLLPASSSYSSLSDVTLECWVEPQDLTNYGGLICKRFDQFPTHQGWVFMVLNEINGRYLTYIDSTGGDWSFSNSQYSIGSWHHAVVTIDSSGNLEFFTNGYLDGSDTGQDYPSDTWNYLSIGGWDKSNQLYCDGKIDEVRISKTARSAEWISTSYNNQNDPSSFLSFGPEETGP